MRLIVTAVFIFCLAIADRSFSGPPEIQAVVEKHSTGTDWRQDIRLNEGSAGYTIRIGEQNRSPVFELISQCKQPVWQRPVFFYLSFQDTDPAKPLGRAFLDYELFDHPAAAAVVEGNIARADITTSVPGQCESEYHLFGFPGHPLLYLQVKTRMHRDSLSLWHYRFKSGGSGRLYRWTPSCPTWAPNEESRQTSDPWYLLKSGVDGKDIGCLYHGYKTFRAFWGGKSGEEWYSAADGNAGKGQWFGFGEVSDPGTDFPAWMAKLTAVINPDLSPKEGWNFLGRQKAGEQTYNVYQLANPGKIAIEMAPMALALDRQPSELLLCSSLKAQKTLSVPFQWFDGRVYFQADISENMLVLVPTTMQTTEILPQVQIEIPRKIFLRGEPVPLNVKTANPKGLISGVFDLLVRVPVPGGRPVTAGNRKVGGASDTFGLSIDTAGLFPGNYPMEILLSSTGNREIPIETKNIEIVEPWQDNFVHGGFGNPASNHTYGFNWCYIQDGPDNFTPDRLSGYDQTQADAMRRRLSVMWGPHLLYAGKDDKEMILERAFITDDKGEVKIGSWPCFAHPVFLEDARKFLHSYAGYLSRWPNLNGVCFDDEPSIEINDRTGSGYHPYEKTKFKELTGFDAPLPPTMKEWRAEADKNAGIVNTAHPWYLWIKYRCGILLNYNRLAMETFHEVVPKAYGTTVYASLTGTGATYGRIVLPPLDVNMVEAYYPDGTPATVTGFNLAVLQAHARPLKAQPWMIQGLCEKYDPFQGFSLVSRYNIGARISLANGAKALTYFATGAIDTPDMAEAVRGTSSWLDAYGIWLRSLKKPISPVALLQSFSADCAGDWLHQPFDMYGWYHLLLARHINPDVILEEDVASDRAAAYRAIVLSSKYMTPDVRKGLDTFIRRGGLVVGNADIPLPGMTKIPGDIISPGSAYRFHIYQKGDPRWTIPPEKLLALKAGVKETFSGIRPPHETESPDIGLFELNDNTNRFLFVINLSETERREPLVRMNRPPSLDVTVVAGEPCARQGEFLRASLPAGEWSVIALLDERPDRVVLETDPAVGEGVETNLTVKILSAGRQAEGNYPVALSLSGGKDGKALWTWYGVAEKGLWKSKVPIWNGKFGGKAYLKAVELITGAQGSVTLNVKERT